MMIFDSLISFYPTPTKVAKVDDFNTEGSCVLINKVGYIMEERLKKQEQKGDNVNTEESKDG